LIQLTTMEFDWLDCPDLNQVEDVTHPAMCTEDLSVVTFDKDHKPSGKPAGDDDSLATAQASMNSTSGATSGPPTTLGVIQGSSKLAPVDLEANDLASMADTVASKADSDHSAAAPLAATTT